MYAEELSAYLFAAHSFIKDRNELDNYLRCAINGYIGGHSDESINVYAAGNKLALKISKGVLTQEAIKMDLVTLSSRAVY